MMNFQIDLKSTEEYVNQIQSRSMSDPTLSDIDFKNKMVLVWTTLNIELETQIFAFRKNGKILIAVPTITETSNKRRMSELKTRKDKSVDFFKTKLRLTKAQTEAIM